MRNLKSKIYFIIYLLGSIEFLVFVVLTLQFGTTWTGYISGSDYFLGSFLNRRYGPAYTQVSAGMYEFVRCYSMFVVVTLPITIFCGLAVAREKKRIKAEALKNIDY